MIPYVAAPAPIPMISSAPRFAPRKARPVIQLGRDLPERNRNTLVMSESNQRVVQASGVAAAISSSESPRSAISDQGTPSADVRHLKRDGDKRRGVVGGGGEYLFGIFTRHPAILSFEHHGDQRDVPYHCESRYLVVGEHPRDGGVYEFLSVEGFVPGGVSLVACCIALRPVTARDGLDDHKPGILALDLLHERLVIGAVPLVCGEDVVPGRKNRLERVTPQGFEVGCGSLVTVSRDADGPDEALFLGLDGGFEGTAGARGAVEVFEVAYRVELEEVHVVHAQAFEGVLDLTLRCSFIAQACLGGEEDAVPDLGHPAPVLELRVPVICRRVEVVHSGVERLRNGRVRVFLGGLRKRGPAEDEHGILAVETSQTTVLHASPLLSPTLLSYSFSHSSFSVTTSKGRTLRRTAP